MELSALEQRILRLERQNVLLRWTICAVLLGVCAFLSCRTLGVGDEVVARSFILRDADGRVRGEWAPSEELLPSENGVGVTASITCLRLRDRQGLVAFQACGRWDDDAASSLLVSSTTGARISIAADSEGASVRVGNQRTPEIPRPPHVGLAADAESASVVVGTGGPRAAVLTLDELMMRDERGHVFLRLPDKPGTRE